ncbi:Transcription antitermination protein NusB [Candidatus Deianiraea vastatrix]|uniref:Transcription antitermination protein NusB n=2 Tax=Candidatus Deianiraea vastatrix TaxID=2163644 RepID=A0A5B8XEF7_9RICK|nr:Transcription antitermination protein NusB [Candidatus Deianiraea vastatrix]
MISSIATGQKREMIEMGGVEFLPEKKQEFEKFLTYKRRMSRMASIQVVYMMDMHMHAVTEKKEEQNILFDGGGLDREIKPEIFCRSVIYIYKNLLLSKKSYGDTPKNKKIDERFLFDLSAFIYGNLEKIDGHISKNLSEKWNVKKIDFLVRSVLRVAIGERLLFGKLDTAILTSEYTNLSSYFFTGKEIGFINGVLHSFCKSCNID